MFAPGIRWFCIRCCRCLKTQTDMRSLQDGLARDCPRYALVMDKHAMNTSWNEASLWPYGSMSARCQLLLRDFEAQQRHLSNLEQETNTFRHHGARETLRDRGCATRSFVLWLNVVQLKTRPVFLEIMMHRPSTDGGMTFNFV